MFEALNKCINGIEPPTCCTKACSPGPANSWGPSPPGIPWVWTTMARVKQKTNTQRLFIVAGDFSVVMQVLGGFGVFIHIRPVLYVILSYICKFCAMTKYLFSQLNKRAWIITVICCQLLRHFGGFRQHRCHSF